MFKAIHYCYLLYMITFEIYELEIYELDLARFIATQGLAFQAAVKRPK